MKNFGNLEANSFDRSTIDKTIQEAFRETNPGASFPFGAESNSKPFLETNLGT